MTTPYERVAEALGIDPEGEQVKCGDCGVVCGGVCGVQTIRKGTQDEKAMASSSNREGYRRGLIGGRI